MEPLPKDFIIDRRTHGVLDIIKTNLQQIAIGSGFSTALVALLGEGKVAVVLAPAVLTVLLTIARATVSRYLELAVVRNPLSVEQNQTVKAEPPLATDSTPTTP